MAMAKPIIANQEIPAHQEFIEESGGGILVAHTADAFAQAIVELLDNPTAASAMGKQGQSWVLSSRSRERWARQIEQRCSDLVGTND
jgi:glycosyltransferase involved in cell wall biosynthesis